MSDASDVGPWSYAKRCCARALKDLWRALGIFASSGLVLGLAGWISLRMAGRSQDTSFELLAAAVVFFGSVVSTLIFSGYWVWRDDKEAAATRAKDAGDRGTKAAEAHRAEVEALRSQLAAVPKTPEEKLALSFESEVCPLPGVRISTADLLLECEELLTLGQPDAAGLANQLWLPITPFTRFDDTNGEHVFFGRYVHKLAKSGLMNLHSTSPTTYTMKPHGFAVLRAIKDLRKARGAAN